MHLKNIQQNLLNLCPAYAKRKRSLPIPKAFGEAREGEHTTKAALHTENQGAQKCPMAATTTWQPTGCSAGDSSHGDGWTLETSWPRRAYPAPP